MLIGPQNLAVNVNLVRSRINLVAQVAGRTPSGVTLIAVSKSQTSAACRAVATAGVADFGENYLQEAISKIDSLTDLKLCWHFIGRLQSNKTRTIALYFDWVHGIDRFEIAKRLSDQRSSHRNPLNLCIQVALVPESTKAGLYPEEVPDLAQKIAALPRVRLRGLMCVPPAQTDASKQLSVFIRLKQLLDQLNSQDLQLDTLSMGMSEDFEAAIVAGATHVRIGSALFGPRTVIPSIKETHEHYT